MGKFISYCLGISAENRMKEFKRVGGEKSKVVRKTLVGICFSTKVLTNK
ncbi:MAG: hypothetical protein U9Q27_00585 [Patescibacteria group bacterium]|nr:hypothetical protein [Patescibacteria group bacterium]